MSWSESDSKNIVKCICGHSLFAHIPLGIDSGKVLCMGDNYNCPCKDYASSETEALKHVIQKLKRS